MPACGNLEGFITAPGSFNGVADKINLDSAKDLCGLGWSSATRTTCNSNGNVISVNPSVARTSVCHPETITVLDQATWELPRFWTAATTLERFPGV
ncbi:hypothetical protein B0H19DRAFT_1249316 [Mycena capillaripes]|nr:hypothetical protein B0H19DRAFT_1249316 [Mycena capillaripes]